ncbi:MAG: nucleotide pyrophosphohydrolase [Clostridia bacterium]|nr:nucleotide pyrophosphohydrolase [Clostridia bacterium]
MNEQEELFSKLSETTTLPELQKYIKNVIELRGFSNKSVQDEMLLLLEEAGELAKAIRKKLPNGTIDKNKISHYTAIEEEVADVFIVLAELCNILDIDLYSAIINKEQENIERKWSESNE